MGFSQFSIISHPLLIFGRWILKSIEYYSIIIIIIIISHLASFSYHC